MNKHVDLRHTKRREDALDSLQQQDDLIEAVLDTWESAESTLRRGDDLDARWTRGSAIKLFLAHLAVREAAIGSLRTALDAKGADALASRLDRDGARRRSAIDRLDEVLRNLQALAANSEDVIAAADALVAIWRTERSSDPSLIAECDAQLGPNGRRKLPSARYVRATATLHPAPDSSAPTPLRLVRAAYEFWRSYAFDSMSPAVRELRARTPGVGA